MKKYKFDPDSDWCIENRLTGFVHNGNLTDCLMAVDSNMKQTKFQYLFELATDEGLLRFIYRQMDWVVKCFD